MLHPSNDVRLEKLNGGWTEFVVADGETTQKTFETKQFASNFAAGQRIRLGLPPGRRTTAEGEAGIINASEMSSLQRGPRIGALSTGTTCW
jgi:hypothetical protein